MKFIPVAEPVIGKEEEKEVLACIKSTWVSSAGPNLGQFETLFANLLNIPYAQSCANGTAALHLALLAIDIKPGDEIILPALTFIATANVVTYTGATPVFVDVTPDTWTIDPAKIEAKITSKTKAILPVHLYGYPAEMEKIMKVAKKHKLFVIEDAAEAHFALYDKKFVGTLGDIGCFSFYGNKIITTGEGGMVVTKSKLLSDKIKLYKNHGMSAIRKYYHPVIGYNYRMTNLQAAIGIAQLGKLKRILFRRAEINKLYRSQLEGTPGLLFQPTGPKINPVCWLFSLLITNKFGKTRDQLMDYLSKNNIDSRPFFYPLTYFKMYERVEKFPVSNKLSRQGINLPSSPNLTNEMISYITKVIKSAAL